MSKSDVMTLYRRGKTYKEIATTTGYSVRHVKRLVAAASDADKALRGFARAGKEHYGWLYLTRLGGYTTAQLAEMCDVSQSHINDGLAKFRREA